MTNWKKNSIILLVGLAIGLAFSFGRKPEVKTVRDYKVEEELRKQLEVYKNIELVTEEQYNCPDGKLSSKRTSLKDNSKLIASEDNKKKSELHEVITQSPKALFSFDLGVKFNTINLDKFNPDGFGLGLNVNHNIKVLPKRITQDFDLKLKPTTTTLWWEVWEFK